ncbi:hypothetical protein [Geoglobus ahangari]
MTEVEFIPKQFVVVSETEPSPFEGLIWYNPQTKLWKMYSGGQWKILIPFYVGDAEPVEKTDGMLWYDSLNDVLRVYDGTQAAFRRLGVDWNDITNKPTAFTPATHSTEHHPDGQDPLRGYTISDEVYASNDAEKTHGPYTDWRRSKEFQLPADFPSNMTLRIYFEMKINNSNGLGEARIRRNGVAVGTYRSTKSTSYVAFTEDIPGWGPNDKIQLYVRNWTSSYYLYVRNFRILGVPGVAKFDIPVTLQ